MKLDSKFFDNLTDADFQLAALIMMEKIRRQLPASGKTKPAQQSSRAKGAIAKTA